MEIKEKVKLTMSSINRKITALIMAMRSIGVKLAAYVSKEGVLINTPNDKIAVGDVVTIEKEGVIDDKATWEGVVVGADGEYKVSIVDGVVKTLEKSETKEDADENTEATKQTQVEQSQQLMASAFNRLIAVNEALIKKVETLQTELNAVKKQNETIWKQMQNSEKPKTHTASTKLSKLREIYNNV